MTYVQDPIYQFRCEVCDRYFSCSRKHAKTCSAKCRKALERAKKSLAKAKLNRWVR